MRAWYAAALQEPWREAGISTLVIQVRQQEAHGGQRRRVGRLEPGALVRLLPSPAGPRELLLFAGGGVLAGG